MENIIVNLTVEINADYGLSPQNGHYKWSVISVENGQERTVGKVLYQRRVG